MQPYQPAARRSAWFWLFVVCTAVFMSLEPSLFLVTLAIGLSALALFWVLLLLRLLLSDAFVYVTRQRATSPDQQVQR